MRNISKVAEGWWDYTTLDTKILNDAAQINRRGSPAVVPTGIYRQIL